MSSVPPFASSKMPARAVSGPAGARAVYIVNAHTLNLACEDPSYRAVLNGGVGRFDADRAAVNYYDRNYTPSGQIGIPVVTLHTTRDPAIPFAHEAMFAAAVAAAGRSQLLVQQPIDRWGHCTFTGEEIQMAFGGLVQWVETGVKP